MSRKQRILLGFSALTLAVSAPVAFSQDGITSNDACAQSGTCCSSPDSCVVNGQVISPGYWKEGSGSCTPKPKPT